MRRPRLALLVSLATAGCDASLTSVGAYEPAATAGDAARTPEDGPVAFYLEAEDGELSGGFTTERDAAASGGAYIRAPAGIRSLEIPGEAHAIYRFSIAEAATFLAWGRIRSPDTEHNSLWVQMDAEPAHRWALSTGEDWYWGSFHDGVDYQDPIAYVLAAGEHVLTVANAADEVSLDRLYLTTGDETPPGNDTPCRPPDSIRIGGVCVPSCGSQGGTTCGGDACVGRPEIAAYDCVVCCVGP